MKKWMALVLLLGLAGQAGWALPGAAENRIEKQQKSEVEKIVQNKALLNDLLDRVVADPALRQQMLQKLAALAKTNPQVMQQVQKMFAGGQAMAPKGDRVPEILVKFKGDVAATQVQALVSELKLQEVKTIPQLNIRVYRLTSAEPVDAVIARIQKKPFVEYAEPNRTYSIQE